MATIFRIIYKDIKIIFIIMDRNNRSINISNSIGNNSINSNYRIRDSLETTVPGCFNLKLKERLFSFSYEESISFDSYHFSDKLSAIFSSSSENNQNRSNSATGKRKCIILNI